MRLFEIIMLGCSALNLVVYRMKAGSPTRQNILALTTIALVFAALLHMDNEGLRWQMLFTYVMAVVLVCINVKQFLRPTEARTYPLWRKALISVGICIVFVVSAAVPALLPVFSFEKLTGPYAVGTVTYHWQDASREETFTAEPRDRRELMVQLWYPAEPNDGTDRESAPYLPQRRAFAKDVERQYGMPAFLLKYIDLVGTRSTEQAPAAKALPKYPVIVFSHGFPGTRFSNTFQVEELASHGYVVASIDHAYSAIATVFPDGRTASFSDQGPSATDLDGSDRLISEVWVKDARFVLDELTKLNEADSDELLSGKLDLSRVGMMGHSFGGANAAQTLLADDRFKAGINMDGTFFGLGDLSNGLRQPFMLMDTSDTGQSARRNGPPEKPTDELLQSMGMTPEQYDRLRRVWNRGDSVLGHGAYELTLEGAQHLSFSDFYLYSPALSWLTGTSIQTREAHRLINAYTVAFFDQYLQGKPSPLLDSNAPQPPHARFIRNIQ